MGFFDKIFGKKADLHEHDHDHSDGHSHGDAHADAAHAGKKHDPVCDMWVDPAKAPAKSDHMGETIYFCAPGCKRAFDANPAKFMPKLKRA